MMRTTYSLPCLLVALCWHVRRETVLFIAAGRQRVWCQGKQSERLLDDSRAYYYIFTNTRVPHACHAPLAEAQFMAHTRIARVPCTRTTTTSGYMHAKRKARRRRTIQTTVLNVRTVPGSPYRSCVRICHACARSNSTAPHPILLPHTHER